MYPEKMSSLPDALFKNLMASLEVGLVKYPFGPFFFLYKRGMHSRVQKSLKLRGRLLEGWSVLAIVNKYRNL